MSLSPYGLLELPWWGYVLVTFATIQSMFLGVTLYLHRDQSHGGLILHPALRHLFRFWLWFSSAAVTREWVAVHRRHHAERRDDSAWLRRILSGQWPEDRTSPDRRSPRRSRTLERGKQRGEHSCPSRGRAIPTRRRSSRSIGRSWRLRIGSWARPCRVKTCSQSENRSRSRLCSRRYQFCG